MRLLPLLAATLVSGVSGAAAAGLPYQDPHAPLETRVADLVGRLTPDEKLSLLGGTGFTTKPIPRLGVPAMVMVDAGQGVRGGMKEMMGPATAFPCGAAMASSWDAGLLGKIGQAIGTEARNKGVGAQVLLGPAVNIHRSPLGGRNGEYFSEDPYLAGRLAVPYIQGMQSTGVAACVKHYACNNEEVDRDFVDVRVGERALREIYLPAFEAAVREGHVWTIMSSYNQVGGLHASANPYLLTGILKGDWGFDGAVISDWGAVHGADSVAAGDDIEMPGPGGFLSGAKAAAALQAGTITPAQVDEADRRIVRTLLRTGLLDGPLPKPDHAQVDSPEHRLLAYTAATEGMVLLRNEGGLLPFDRAKLRSLAVVGPAAKSMQLGAEGSPRVEPVYSVGPAEGIARHAGPGVAVTAVETVLTGDAIPASAFATPDGKPGLRAEIFANRSLQGTPALVRVDPGIDAAWDKALPPAPGVGPNEFSIRWTGTLDAPDAGHYGFTLVADDGCRLIIDGKPVIDHWVESGPVPVTGDAELAKGRHTVEADFFQAAGGACMHLSWRTPDKAPFAAEIAAAKAADAAVVCVSTRGTEGEGHDRPSMALPFHQDDLIRAVAAANPRTVVVLNNGTPVDATAWLGSVPALLEAWFPGQEGGNALGALLFGDAAPSGRLPDTFAAKRGDYPDFGGFPGTKGTVRYAEGIYVGYRAFDKKGIAPAFPFGHGLSYTTFAYGKPSLSAPELRPDGTVRVSLDVTNTGKRAGTEVVELYVAGADATPQVDRPVRELKGFARVALAPGETKPVRFDLAPRALAYFDVPGHQWKADAGSYRLDLGASSRDIRQTAVVKLAAPFTEPVPSSRPDMDGIAATP